MKLSFPHGVGVLTGAVVFSLTSYAAACPGMVAAAPDPHQPNTVDVWFNDLAGFPIPCTSDNVMLRQNEETGEVDVLGTLCDAPPEAGTFEDEWSRKAPIATASRRRSRAPDTPPERWRIAPASCRCLPRSRSRPTRPRTARLRWEMPARR